MLYLGIVWGPGYARENDLGPLFPLIFQRVVRASLRFSAQLPGLTGTLITEVSLRLSSCRSTEKTRQRLIAFASFALLLGLLHSLLHSLPWLDCCDSE